MRRSTVKRCSFAWRTREKSAAAKPVGSWARPKGNPTAVNLFGVIAALQDKTGVHQCARWRTQLRRRIHPWLQGGRCKHDIEITEALLSGIAIHDEPVRRHDEYGQKNEGPGGQACQVPDPQRDSPNRRRPECLGLIEMPHEEGSARPMLGTL
jgi:hypothetical protein